MNRTPAGHSMDDVLKYVDRFSEGKSASKALFYFLYKEILVNRVNILEANPTANRAAIEHAEKVINDLNVMLMNQLKQHA